MDIAGLPEFSTDDGAVDVDRLLKIRDSSEAREFRDWLGSIGQANDLASWLALMQHYGTPTRFLDWTMSPFIAAYFAFEDEACGLSKRSAIWAINLNWLEQTGRELLGAYEAPDRDSGATAENEYSQVHVVSELGKRISASTRPDRGPY
jgi:FRG domain